MVDGGDACVCVSFCSVTRGGDAAAAVGDDVFVRWPTTTGAEASTAAPARVHVELCTTPTARGGTPATRIAHAIANRGAFLWNVRATHLGTAVRRDCRLTIVDAACAERVVTRSEPFVLCAASVVASDGSVTATGAAAQAMDTTTDDDDGDYHHHRRQRQRHITTPPSVARRSRSAPADMDDDDDDDDDGSSADDEQSSVANAYDAATPEGIYARVYMRTCDVRSHLMTIVRTSDAQLNVDTELRSLAATSSGDVMRAGEFCVRYVLLEHYRKRVSADVAARVHDAATRRARRRRRGHANNAHDDSNSGGGSGGYDDDDQGATTTLSTSDSSPALPPSTPHADAASPHMGACVRGCTIAQQRAYLRHIRDTALALDIDAPFPDDVYADAPAATRALTVATFALEYVRTNRRKRTLNVRRAKNRARARSGGGGAGGDAGARTRSCE